MGWRLCLYSSRCNDGGEEKMTFNEQIESLLSKQKEIDYIVATETIKEYLVTWPSNVDSKLWNHRVESLLKRIDEKFERTQK